MDDDRALFEGWCGGDRRAGLALFDRYYAPVSRFFHNKVSEAAAPDLIQSTFLACVEGRDRFRGDGEFRSYLFGIAHNLLRKHYRTQSTHGDALDFDEACVADLAPSTSQVMAARQEQRLLL